MTDKKKKVDKKAKEQKICADCECKVCKCKPEVELFVKLGKFCEAMAILGVGCLVRSKGELCFVPGVKIVNLGKVNVLTKI